MFHLDISKVDQVLLLGTHLRAGTEVRTGEAEGAQAGSGGVGDVRAVQAPHGRAKRSADADERPALPHQKKPAISSHSHLNNPADCGLIQMHGKSRHNT